MDCTCYNCLDSFVNDATTVFTTYHAERRTAIPPHVNSSDIIHRNNHPSRTWRQPGIVRVIHMHKLNPCPAGYSFLNLSNVSLLMLNITFLLNFRCTIYHSKVKKS